MKPIILFLLLLTAGACAQLAPSADTVRRVEAMVTEAIPRLKFEEATFEDALGAVRRTWEERQGEDPFPVAIADHRKPEEYRGKTPIRITFDLKNIPYIEALRYIAGTTDRQLVSIGGVFLLKTATWDSDDWEPRSHVVSPTALTALNLKPDSSKEDVRRAFRQLGVKLEDWTKLGLMDAGKEMLVVAPQVQQEQIAGILVVLDNGFRISK